MRLFLVSIFFLIVAFSKAQTPTAAELLQPAYQKAAAENKKVLLIFHASWCGWCRKLDASLQDRFVKPLMDKSFVTVHLTVYESANKKHLENKGALPFLTKLGGADKGLPYWYVLDRDGTVICDSQYKAGQNTGCPASEEEVAYFISILQITTSLSVEELEVIRKRFRQNE